MKQRLKIQGIILVLVTVFTVSGLHAQEFGSNVINAPVKKQPVTTQKYKPDVSFTLGTSFSSFGPGFNTFGTYVMPEITFPVSKKFAIRTSIGYSNMFYSTPGGEGSMFSQSPAQYGHISISGLYRVNEKLTIAGTAFKTFDLNPRKNQVNPRALDFSNEGVMLNLDYKVSDHVRINASFSYQKRNPYYYYNNGGFMNNGFSGSASPFYHPGFGPSF